MTAPPPEVPGAEPGRPWYARSGLVFGALGVILLATVLLTPAQDDQGDQRLTTLSRSPYAARAVADLAARLGWRVERDSAVPRFAALPADRVYAILAPPEALTGREYGRVLDAVRRGAGLLVVHPGDPLGDSLGIDRSRGGARMRVAATAASDCPAEEKRYAITWPGGDVYSLWLVPRRPLADTVHWLPVMRPLTRDERRARGAPDVQASVGDDEDEDDDATIGDSAIVEGAPTAGSDSSATGTDSAGGAPRRIAAPAAIGLPLGRGRVVLLADPDWLRNDVVRVCRWNAAVTTMRMLEWLAAGGTPRRIEFDEWHQGRGVHASAMAALGTFLVGDARGRMLLQGIGAALLLLAALGARPLVPVGRERIERRSPFEHVGALARAYEEIGATRLVARRLVRGLRRRLGSNTVARDEEALLAALEVRHPSLAPQIALVRDAMRTARTPAALLDVGRAVAEIERTILKS